MSNDFLTGAKPTNKQKKKEHLVSRASPCVGVMGKTRLGEKMQASQAKPQMASA